MPVGFPSPARRKTFRSRQLVNFFNTKIEASTDARLSRLTVHHINDQSLGLNREGYREAKTEKNARAAHYSAIKRALGNDAIIIADALNYIKGFRYQLYCEAKAVQTTSCVVHVGTPIDKCREINEKILSGDERTAGYEKEIFDNLIFRYEEPNGMTRWDSPLFTVPYDDEQPPCEAIWEAIVGSDGKTKIVKPNQATITAPTKESDYLYELDRISQDVLSRISDWQKDHPEEGGGEIAMEKDIIRLPANPVSLPKLQRVRRQFISLNRQHTLPRNRIRTSFVEFLNDNLD